MKNRQKYLLFGALFGALFPLVSTLIILLENSLPFTPAGFLQAQKMEPLLWVIDSAPFFLGFLSYIAGNRQDRIGELNTDLRVALANSQLFNEHLTSNAHFGIILCDAEGFILSFNKGATELTGLSAEEVQGKMNLMQFFPTGDVEILTQRSNEITGRKLKPGFESLIAPAVLKSADEFECQWLVPGNQVLYIRMGVSRITSEKGLRESFLLIATNITQQKKIELSLKESEQKIMQVLDVVPVGVYVLDRMGKAFIANQRAVEILGRGIAPEASPDDLASIYNAYISGTQLLYPTSRMPLVRALTGETSRIEDMVIRRDKEEVELEVMGSPVLDSQGKVAFAVAAFLDVTDRKRTQRELAQSEQSFRAIFESANLGILLFTPSGNITQANSAFSKMVGLPGEELRQSSIFFIISQESKAELERSIQKLSDGFMGGQEMVMRFKGPFRDTVWAQVSLGAVRDSRGHLVNVVAVVENITFRIDAEKKQKDTLDNLTIANADLDLFTSGLRQLHKVLTSNYESEVDQMEAILQTGCRVFTTKFGFVGKVDDEYLTLVSTNSNMEGFGPGLRFRKEQSLANFITEKQETISLHHAGADPVFSKQPDYLRYKIETYIATPLYVRNQFYGVLGFFSLEQRPEPFRARDREYIELLSSALGRTLELRLSRQEIEESAQRVETSNEELRKSNESLDQFAYVVSHDLKAPLRGINSLAEWIGEDLGDQAPPEVMEKLELLKGRVIRLSNLINGILEYSRIGRNRGTKIRIETTGLVKEVLDFLDLQAGATVEVPDDLPSVVADRTDLSRIFINLISNALKYSDKAQPEVKILWNRDGGQVAFCVKDNGPGIEARFHEKIFGIFQRLEARDNVEGTGIGLSIVKKIVEENGGKAWVESEPGKGAEFWFTWPG